MNRYPLARVPLGPLLLPVQTWNPARDALGSTISYVDLSSVDNDLKQVTSSQQIPADQAPSRARQLVHAGDILVSTVRPNLNGVARVPDMLDGATASTGYCVLRPDQMKLSATYLFQWVRTPAFIAEMVRMATGASYPAVSDRIIHESELPLPPLHEQRRIAELLDHADGLQRKRRLALEYLDSLMTAVFVEMFGDMRSNSKGWKVLPFGDVCCNQDSLRRPVRAADREGRQGEFPYYGASGIIDYVDEFIFDGERLLIGEDGANLLARSTPIAFLASGRFWVNNHAHVLASNGVAELRFLEFYLNQIDLKPFVTGSAQPKLNQANLERIPVPTPPAAVQRQFLERLEERDRVKELHKRQLALFEALFASLQHRAFNGMLTSKDAEREIEMVG